MQKNTAIQGAIFRIEKWRNNESADFVYGLNTAINILIEMYPVEKQQIEDAFAEGMCKIVELVYPTLIKLDSTIFDGKPIDEINKVRNGGKDDVSADYYASTYTAMPDEADKVEMSDDEEDDERRMGWECPICGADSDLGEKCAINCPNNDSPYAELLRNGYD